MATIETHVTRELLTLDELAPCAEAARLMRERKVGSVAVSRGGAVIGLVSERDLVGRVLARQASAMMPVAEAARQDLPIVSVRASEREVADLMKAHGTRHLLVEERGEVCGVISMRDVIQLILDDKERFIEELQRYVQG